MPPESHLRRNCGATPWPVHSQGPGADVRPGCHRTPQLPGLGGGAADKQWGCILGELLPARGGGWRWAGPGTLGVGSLTHQASREHLWHLERLPNVCWTPSTSVPPSRRRSMSSGSWGLRPSQRLWARSDHGPGTGCHPLLCVTGHPPGRERGFVPEQHQTITADVRGE